MDIHSRTRWRAYRPRVSSPAEALTRRITFKKVAGAVVALAAGSSALSGVLPSRAKATSRQVDLLAATTVEEGGLAPAVVMLTDAPTIAIDASLGNDFRITLGASRSMGNPINSVDGQQIIFHLTQGTAGSAGITWGSNYEFSTALPQPVLSTAAGQTDLLGFIYSAAKGKWLFAAFVNGFD